MEYQTVILAAFLHDIGKFLGRGDFKLLDKGQHPGFLSTFVSAHDSFFSRIAGGTAEIMKLIISREIIGGEFEPL